MLNLPGDVLSDGEIRDWHHWYGGDGGEPIGLVIPDNRWNPQMKLILSLMNTQGNPEYNTLGFESLGYFLQIIFLFHQH